MKTKTSMKVWFDERKGWFIACLCSLAIPAFIILINAVAWMLGGSVVTSEGTVPITAVIFLTVAKQMGTIGAVFFALMIMPAVFNSL
jgi:hypothetical protein